MSGEASDAATNAFHLPSPAELIKKFDCPICHDLLHLPVVGRCGHDFCKHCYERWAEDKAEPPCPICKRALPLDLNVCVRLRDTISYLFPERAALRAAEVAKQQDAHRNSGRRTRRTRARPDTEAETMPRQNGRRVRGRHVHNIQRTPETDAPRERPHLEWVSLPSSNNAVHGGSVAVLSSMASPEVSILTTGVVDSRQLARRDLTLYHRQTGQILRLRQDWEQTHARRRAPLANARDQAPSNASGQTTRRSAPTQIPQSSSTPPPVPATNAERNEQHPHFTVGTRYSPVQQLRYSSIVRLYRSVPTQFGPNFSRPPVTFNTMSDLTQS